MISVKNMFICGLVLSFLIVGCGQKEERPEYAGQQAEEEAAKAVEEAAPAEVAEEAAEAVEEVAEKVAEESMKEKTASIIKELIAKARALLDQGKFKEAIVPAQDVLTNYDSDSQEAKGIIAKAKEKLEAMVTDTEKVEDIKGEITDKLKGFGK